LLGYVCNKVAGVGGKVTSTCRDTQYDGTSN